MSAQERVPGGIKVKAIVIDGDTIPYVELAEIKVYGKKVFKTNKERKQWDKLVKNVKKVYPLAKIAGIKMREYEAILIHIKDERSKKILMQNAEKALKSQFEKDIRQLTFSQGRILIKLIDRETGKTSYQIIREFRGMIQAVFWQTLARIFENNLKDEYDPFGEDKAIEEIVLKIESGDI
ncbi:MAG: DUF4294 domain-containing protein [Bacteroidales bacterium]|nr:DUF4294 domain-containing protein [Bacteroidales bacterium]